MNNYASRWHTQRRLMLTAKFSEIKKLKKIGKVKNLLDIILIPALHIGLALLCIKLNLWLVFICAWVFGALFRMRIFNNMHEICHGLYPHPSLNKNRFLLFYSNLSTLTSDYSYYRRMHISHHRLLGSQSLEESVKNFNAEKPVDGDIFDLSFGISTPSFAKILMRENISELQTSKLSHHFLTRILLVGFLRPLHKFYFELTACFRTLVYLGVLLVYAISGKYYFFKVSKQALLEAVIAKISHLTFLLLLFYFSGWNALIYLFLSDLFYRGFLFHPCLAFFLAVHKSSNTESQTLCQPTTSVYGKYMTVLCGGVNYHTEHHDFPDMPVSQLTKLNKICHDDYKNLFHYNGAFEVFYDYFFKSGNNWIYSCQNQKKLL